MTLLIGIVPESNRLIRRTLRKILHLNVQTGSQFLHTRVRDGGLVQLRYKVPCILLRRLENLKQGKDITNWNTILSIDEQARTFYIRAMTLACKGDPDAFWKEEISIRPYSSGLQDAVEDVSSRRWIAGIPRGWAASDYVRAVQLRTGNLPTQA